MKNENIASAKIKKHSLSPLWFLTLVACLLGGWLLFKSISEAGTMISIHFKDAQGIEPGRTAIRYQGLDIGIIRSVSLEDNLTGVNAEAEIFPQAQQILRKDTLFWVVKPKASITGVSGLDALVGGNYIAVLPGIDDEEAREFIAASTSPSIIPSNDDFLVYLTTNDLGSLSIGTSVFYKKIQVGTLFNYELDQDDQSVMLSLSIEKRYANLIKNNSRFWNISGIKANIGLQGVNLEVASLPSLIAGGIAFDSPKEGKAASSKSMYTLYSSINEAERGVGIEIRLPAEHGIKNTNLTIAYKGSEIGRLTSIEYNKQENYFSAKANIDPSMTWLLKTGTKFIIEQAEIGLAGVKNIANFVTGNTLSIKPGQGEPSTKFIAETQKQEIASQPNVLKLRLTTNDLWGINNTTKVIYKGVEVGFVEKYALSNDQAFIDVVIFSDFRYLVKSDSRFYRLGGISGAINAEGVEFNVAPVSQLMQGAISFTSSGKNKLAKSYPLFDSKSQAEKAKLAKLGNKTLTLVADTLPSISENSPVMYKNISVGKVTALNLEKDQVKINIQIENQYAHLLTKDTVFWNHSGIGIQAGFSGINIQAASLKSIIKGGISFSDLKGIKSKKGSSFILYDSLKSAQNQGMSIVFTSEQSYGLKIGSEIRYQGVAVGEITDIRPRFDYEAIQVNAIIYPEFAENIAKKSSYFWVSLPSISLSKTENLDSLFSTHISVLPGKGSVQSKFVLHDTQQFTGGLTLVLESTSRDSISVGAPVLFRDFEVGNVTDVSLGYFADRVLIEVKILEKYKHLVRTNTVFWNQSGLNVSVGLTGANIKTGTVENLLRGGIAFATPKTKALAPVTKQNQHFLLHQEAKAEWLTWSTAIPPPH